MTIKNTKAEILKAYNALKKEKAMLTEEAKILWMKPTQIKIAIAVLVLSVVILTAILFSRPKKLKAESALIQRSADSLKTAIEAYRIAGEAAVQQAVEADSLLQKAMRENSLLKNINDKKLNEKVTNNHIATYDELLFRANAKYNYDTP